MAVRHVYDTRPRQRRLWLAWLTILAVAILAATTMGKGLIATDATANLTDNGPTGSGPTATATATAPGTTAVATALAPGLVDAFARAVAAASDAGHDLTITDGFRTATQQQALFDAEVEERGSVEEAAHWVFPPDQSMHVRGLAIDVGDGPAADWLAAEGYRFGLCQTLGWEWWHFEWRTEWEAAGDCPAPATDP
jgi:D-alanyl-D-alanine carboxypeptidase